MKSLRPVLIALLVGGLIGDATTASAVTLSGGSSKRRDCLLQMQTEGVGFPAGKSRFKGTTCADGDSCDADGTRDGVCRFLTLLCVNQSDEALSNCGPAEVASITMSGKVGKGQKLDPAAYDDAIASLGLPTSDTACSTPVAVDVAVVGPNGKGRFKEGVAKLKGRAKTSRGRDKDRYRLVCLPAVSVPPSTTSTTTIDGTTTTTTLPPLGTPGPGLQAEIVAAVIEPDGTVRVTFTLTDDAGVPITPTTSRTSDPAEARTRITLARLEVVEASGGVDTEFTRYVNYITRTATAGDVTTEQPTYDTSGEYTLVDAATGTWMYTFGNQLPAGFPENLTHTVGAQIERETEGGELVANPLFNFVPDGSPVTTVREVTTTAQCNGCHNPLAIHGGGRREVGLCQLCHTDQTIDPDSGNLIDLKHMIHRIHRGRELPSVDAGPVGTRYEIIGFNQSSHVYGEKVNVCEGGEFASAPCDVDADCPGGTCTGESTVGVGFPRDIRDCGVCHSDGATVQNAIEKPGSLACTGCHDHINPGETELNGLDPGTGHLVGAQSEADCRVCHTPTGNEFDLSVPGAHTLPARSTQLAGVNGEILSAAGAPTQPLTMTFRLTDDDGQAITDLSGFDRVAIAMSGPSTDFGGASVPLIRPVLVGSSASGALTGPDVDGIFTYVTDDLLPADASGTWRVGIEARREIDLVVVPPHEPASVQEAVQNPVFDLSVDGSEVEPRRTVVDIGLCGSCHGVFSETFSMHGNLRNRVEYCVICHNANVTDFARRSVAVVDDGGSPVNEPIALKHLLHKIHTGEGLTNKPYIVYGFGSAGFTPHDFSEVLFPGDLSACGTCHVDDSYELPLPGGLLPTALTEVDTSGMTPVEVLTGSIPPIQDACLACHDDDASAAHAVTNTTVDGDEACNVCHAEGSEYAVSEVHAHED